MASSIALRQQASLAPAAGSRRRASPSLTVRVSAVVAPFRATNGGNFDNPFTAELEATAQYIAKRGKGILASDESNATTGKRLASVGVENTEENRRAWRELLYTAPGLGQYISGAIMFDETLYQKTAQGVEFVKVLKVSWGEERERERGRERERESVIFWSAATFERERRKKEKKTHHPCLFSLSPSLFSLSLFFPQQDQGIVPGIKVDTGLEQLPGTDGETATQGLDGLGARCAAYYKQVRRS